VTEGSPPKPKQFHLSFGTLQKISDFRTAEILIKKELSEHHHYVNVYRRPRLLFNKLPDSLKTVIADNEDVYTRL